MLSHLSKHFALRETCDSLVKRPSLSNAFLLALPHFSLMAKCANQAGPTMPSPTSIEWIVDSGASGIYTRERGILRNTRPSSIAVSGSTQGAGVMRARFVGDYGPFTGVLYLPQISVNLLSVSHLKRQGFRVCLNDLSITKGNLFFRIKEDTRTGLYIVTMPRVFKANCDGIAPPVSVGSLACVTYTSRNLAEVYHRRFNHISKRALLNVLKIHGIKIPSRHFSQMRLCDGCALGKATNARVPSKMPRRPIPKQKPAPAKFTKPFELVCVDTAGPVAPPSHGGSVWMHMFRCKVSGYIHISCTRHRSDFYSEFVLFHQTLVLAHGHKLRVLRSDNAPELTRGPMVAYRAQHGITSQTTAPYSSFGNGIAERAIRTASECVRAMMADTSVPAQFWSYAALAFAHVHNRLPRLGKASPIKLLTGRRPRIDYIRIFGCRCHVYMHPAERAKSARFRPVSQPGIFLGYTTNSKSFHVLINKRVYQRRSVSFNEDVDELKHVHAPSRRRAVLPDTNFGVPFEMGTGGRKRLCDLTQDSPQLAPITNGVQNSQQRECRSPNENVTTNDHVTVNEGAPSRGNTPNHPDNGQMNASDVPDPFDFDPGQNESEHAQPHLAPVTLDSPAPVAPTTNRYPTRSRVPPPRLHPVITGPQKYTGPLALKNQATVRFAENKSPIREHAAHNGGSFWNVATQEFAMTTLLTNDIPTPKTCHEAVNGPHAQEWIESTESELNSMKKKNVWRVVKATPQRPIGAKWVFRVKQDQSGRVTRFKARIVAKGFAQRYGVDFWDTWAPVAHYTTIRSLLAFAARQDLTLRQLDADTAFLNALMTEKVYVKPPPGVKVPRGHVLLLNKCLYGCRQSSREWWLCIDKIFKTTLKMKSSGADPCLCYRFANGTMIFVCLFVDDIIIASNCDKAIEEVKTGLESHFSLTDQGDLEWCLGMRITRDRARKMIQIDQERYILDVLTRFGMNDCTPVSHPMLPGSKLTSSQCPSTDAEISELPSYHALYRSIVGSVSYAALTTRPDIAVATTICAKFAHNPGKEHLVAAKRILRYLLGKPRLCLTYGGGQTTHVKDRFMFSPRCPANLHFCGFTDSDWAGDCDNRKSTTGYIFFMNGGPVCWKSKLQSCIAQSTAEAEYIAASQAAKEAKWLRLLIDVLEHPGQERKEGEPKATQIFCDNQATIAIIDNPRCSARTKHIELRYHLVRDYALRGLVKFTHVPTECNMADLLTKPLNAIAMRRLCDVFMYERSNVNEPVVLKN